MYSQPLLNWQREINPVTKIYVKEKAARYPPKSRAGSAWLGPSPLGSSRAGSAWLGSGSARLGLGSARARLGSGSARARLGSARFGSARARLGSARFGLGSGSAGLGSARLGLGSGSARARLGSGTFHWYGRQLEATGGNGRQREFEICCIGFCMFIFVGFCEFDFRICFVGDNSGRQQREATAGGNNGTQRDLGNFFLVREATGGNGRQREATEV